jgi:hypothetical protein
VADPEKLATTGGAKVVLVGEGFGDGAPNTLTVKVGKFCVCGWVDGGCILAHTRLVTDTLAAAILSSDLA